MNGNENPNGDAWYVTTRTFTVLGEALGGETEDGGTDGEADDAADDEAGGCACHAQAHGSAAGYLFGYLFLLGLGLRRRHGRALE